jgi:bifunctional UDP-N-acetylglucosamine pyrophosphorylase/glucosamine-1-phosphate N-acetyltransferase
MRLIAAREDAGAACSVLTTRLEDPTGYGRVVRDSDGSIAAIVEHKDLAEGQHAIDEVNTSTYCFDTVALFEHLHRLQNANAQGEYYLTDMVAHFRDAGLGVVAVEAADPDETLGVNSRVQLSEAASVLQRRINERHMLNGVTMTDPGLVWIGPDVEIGRDTVIEPLTFVLGDTVIGEECVLGPGSRLTDCRIGDGCRVDDSVLTGVVVSDHETVGPWIRRIEGAEVAGDGAPEVSEAAHTDTIPCDDGLHG